MAIQDERHRRSKSNVKPPESKAYAQAVPEENIRKRKILPSKYDSPKEVSQKLMFLIAVAVLSVSVYILLDYLQQGWDALKQTEHLSSLYSSISQSHADTANSTASAPDLEDTTPRPLLPAAQELLKINPDTIGWVEIPDTLLSLPVVLRPSAEEGNTFYLTRDFNGQKKRSGTVFADYRTTVEDRSQSDNVVLYAHNESNDTMFGSLDLYKQSQNGVSRRWTEDALAYYKSHSTFKFNTNYEEAVYKIFAYFVTSSEAQYPGEEVFDYNNYINFDESRYEDFIQQIDKRNRIVTDIDTQFGDKFVTLSTCSNEYEDARLVVIGRKVRPGEDPTVNTALVSYAENPLEPDLSIIYNKK